MTTSEDNSGYLRVDVFDAKMNAFMAEIRLGNEKLRNELHTEIQGVKNELNSKIDGVKNDLHSEMQGLKSELTSKIEILSTRMDGLELRMTDLQYSVSWQFTIVAILVAVIGIIIGAAVAFAPSIWAFIRRVRQPALSSNDIKNIVSEQVNNALENYFEHRTDLRR